MKEIILDSKETLRERMTHVWDLVKNSDFAKPIIIEIKLWSKSRDQEKKYHAMIQDIAAQVKTGKPFNVTVWKGLLVEQFGQEKAILGEPLRNPGKLYPSLDGDRLVSVRPSSKDFSVKEACDFIEYLYSFGSEQKVMWSEPALEAYQTYCQGGAE